MHYTQLFRSLREAKGLTLEALAAQARCHRNTVINVESGRPVKFKTISRLVQKMGYAPDSADMKGIALLWLEAASGIRFSQPEVAAEAIADVRRHQAGMTAAAAELQAAALDAHLSREQIDLLIFALRQPDALAILGHVRALTTRLAVYPATAREDADDGLMVAEDE
ncbi:MAG: helix-turn-helix transcriptional regulator [Verrucomicrobiota bacterium]